MESSAVVTKTRAGCIAWTNQGTVIALSAIYKYPFRPSTRQGRCRLYHSVEKYQTWNMRESHPR